MYEKNSPHIDPALFELGLPILGICYGHQLIVHILKGKVEPKNKEYGLAKISVTKSKGIFEGLPAQTNVWMSHGDSVTSLPKGFSEIGHSDTCRYSAIAHFQKKIYGVQFHVEVVHTEKGVKILDNFLRICGVKRQWNMKRFLADELEKVKTMVGARKVFMLVSGGVDSLVAFTLLNTALGKSHVYGLFVDTGFMRLHEGAMVKKAVAELGFNNFHAVNASKDFFAALRNVADPEKKREIIGNLFLKIQRREIKKLKLNPREWLLGQGTIYPDTIESGGTKNADKIKTHHNRVPEIESMIKKGLVVEPLKELYKDEVREVGERLGLPGEVVWRHPFPGPGLAVRCLCVNKAKQFATFSNHPLEIFLDERGFHGMILPIESVGVQGDARSYKRPVLIWPAVKDKMFSWDVLEKISTRITNQFHEINRVLFLLSPTEVKDVHVISNSFLTLNRIKSLQKYDDVVMKFLEKEKLTRTIWQFPTVLVPLAVNGAGREMVVLRPVESQEAMTANFYRMPRGKLQKLTKSLKALKPGALAYDITHKPPATIEWE
ncbi:MAG: GMP synthase [Candidatus Peregrinibacteria bacterium GW2011_GWA2_47_7]|nr:MAG: GMP synthase [Candidatus Peregrinibacteria bacterium GW2011_GWA2_47_7]